MTKLLKSKKPRRKNDNYPTPSHVARWVVHKCSELAIPSGGFYYFLEPGCGDLAPFATAAKALSKKPSLIDVLDIRDLQIPKHTFDIVAKDVDFLDCKSSWRAEAYKYDIIATNPPFSSALEFWRRSIELLTPGGVLGLVTKLSFLGSKGRAEVWRHHPPAEVHVFYPRPSFTGDGGTDIGQEYCAAFWYTKEMSKLICRSPLTTMSWVNLKERQEEKDA